MNREAITEALYQRFAEMEGLRSTGRKPKTFDQISPGECPALFLGVGSSASTGNPGPRARWRLEFIVYLYCHDGSAAGPSSQINDYLGRIDAACRATSAEMLAPGTGPDMTTLGGLVLYARPVSVETDEGSFGDRGVAIVTIEVLTAG